MENLQFTKNLSIKGKFDYFIPHFPFLLNISANTLEIWNINGKILYTQHVEYDNIYDSDTKITITNKGYLASYYFVNNRIFKYEKHTQINIKKYIEINGKQNNQGIKEVILDTEGNVTVNDHIKYTNINDIFSVDSYLYLVRENEIKRTDFHSAEERKTLESCEHLFVLKTGVIISITEEEFIFMEFNKQDKRISNLLPKSSKYFVFMINAYIFITNDCSDVFTIIDGLTMEEYFIEEELKNLRIGMDEEGETIFIKNVAVDGEYVYMLTDKTIDVFVNGKEKNIEVVDKVEVCNVTTLEELYGKIAVTCVGKNDISKEVSINNVPITNGDDRKIREPSDLNLSDSNLKPADFKNPFLKHNNNGKLTEKIIPNIPHTEKQHVDVLATKTFSCNEEHEANPLSNELHKKTENINSKVPSNPFLYDNIEPINNNNLLGGFFNSASLTNNGISNGYFTTKQNIGDKVDKNYDLHDNSIKYSSEDLLGKEKLSKSVSNDFKLDNSNKFDNLNRVKDKTEVCKNNNIGYDQLIDKNDLISKNEFYTNTDGDFQTSLNPSFIESFTNNEDLNTNKKSTDANNKIGNLNNFFDAKNFMPGLNDQTNKKGDGYEYKNSSAGLSFIGTNDFSAALEMKKPSENNNLSNDFRNEKFTSQPSFLSPECLSSNVYENEFLTLKKQLTNDVDSLIINFKSLKIPKVSFKEFTIPKGSLETLILHIYTKVVNLQENQHIKNIEYKLTLLEKYLENIKTTNFESSIKFIDNFIINLKNKNFIIPFSCYEDLNEGIRKLKIESGKEDYLDNLFKSFSTKVPEKNGVKEETIHKGKNTNEFKINEALKIDLSSKNINDKHINNIKADERHNDFNTNTSYNPGSFSSSDGLGKTKDLSLPTIDQNNKEAQLKTTNQQNTNFNHQFNIPQQNNINNPFLQSNITQNNNIQNGSINNPFLTSTPQNNPFLIVNNQNLGSNTATGSENPTEGNNAGSAFSKFANQRNRFFK